MDFFRVCVVLAFLEVSKEWFLGCVGGDEKGATAEAAAALSAWGFF